MTPIRDNASRTFVCAIICHRRSFNSLDFLYPNNLGEHYHVARGLSLCRVQSSAWYFSSPKSFVAELDFEVWTILR